MEENKRGRPRGSKSKSDLDLGKKCKSTRRPKSAVLHESRTREATSTRSKSVSAVSTVPTASASSETVQRPRRDTVYLIGSGLHAFGNSKLPKTSDVVRRLYQLKLDGIESKVAYKTVGNEIKDVYEHHFSTPLIYGETRLFLGLTKESAKLIITDKKIDAVLKQLYSDWTSLSYDHSHQDRKGFNPDTFKVKEGKLRDKLLDPLKIHKNNPGYILQHSGVIEWQTDLLHLENQMKRSQEGTVGGTDVNQKQRDLARKKRLSRNEMIIAKQQKETDSPVEISTTSASASSAESSQDEFKEPATKQRKIDLMGKTAATADRLGLSHADRAMYAASVANALGVDVEDTNISLTSSKRKSKETRQKVASDIYETFKVPDVCVVHWDGKIMQVKKGIKSDRCAVLISGMTFEDGEHMTKLLGVPEIPSGTGAAQEKAVTTQLRQWGVQDAIVGVVFDTTASTTGKWRIEEELGRGILSLACRHHIYELHIKHVTDSVTGNTKDPGVSLFRRLKSSWHTLEIQMDQVVKFNHQTADESLQRRALEVLAWAIQVNDK